MKNFTCFHEHFISRCSVSKKQLLFLFTLFTALFGYSQTFNAADNNGNILEFNILASNTARVIDYVSGGTDIDIPATVTYNSVTYPVTRIDNTSFSGENITSVIIPDGVTYIGNYTFEDNQLTNVIIPSSVTFIGEQAFSNNNLSNVTLFNGIVDIDDFAFEMNQLTSITLPSSLTDIGYYVFGDNPLLTCVVSEATTPPIIVTGGSGDSFGVNRSNINLSIPTGTLSDYTNAQWTGFNSVAEGLTGTFVVDYITYQINATPNNEVTVIDYNTAGGTDVTIPVNVNSGCTTFSVTSIGNVAFNNKQLTSVLIPISVTSIGNAAFYQNQLTNINIPDSVTDIGTQAFRSNLLINITISSNLINLNSFVFADNQITDVTFSGNSITTIGAHAFRGNQLQSFNIPSSVTSIGDEAFRDNLLTSITIPGTITIINEFAFYNNQLTTVNILSGVTTIESAAFSQNQIASVTLPDSITTIGSNAFSFNQLTNVSIPDSVTTIEQVAFFTNQLTSVIIPENVTSIGFWAFDSNPLTDVTSLAITPPTIATVGTNNTNDTFSANNRGNIHLHIPVSTTAAYTTDMGALWTGFNPVTEDASLSTSDFELVNDIKVITTSSEIKVITSNTVILENYTIYSISGAKIKEGIESTIGIDAISNGIYIIELNFDKGTLVKKVVLY
ncbi:leucine-rich repeat domain-containing protein [Winogradskyella flava]|uniref:leucine-rich repeat domain-containing protein n=1 Tax=Winogradskyella flava TaxID=1884876 RepID=UPI00248FEA13|nr:leucine-rich repeat domain-containing protein [Winogradskyella flava]